MTLITLVRYSLNGYRYFSIDFLLMFSMSFLIHELSHIFPAQYYHSMAEFRANINGLIMTAISANPFIPFKFIAPGAVMVRIYDNDELGKVALVGTLNNILFCIIFYNIYLFNFNSSSKERSGITKILQYDELPIIWIYTKVYLKNIIASRLRFCQ